MMDARKFSAIDSGLLADMVDSGMKAELDSILHGKAESWRHSEFCHGPPKSRENLKVASYSLETITSCQWHAVLERLASLYCQKDMKAEIVMKRTGGEAKSYEAAKPPILFQDILKTKSRLIGRGAFGDVYQSTSDNQPIAVKVLHKESLCDLLVAIDRLNLFDHPNLMNLIGYCEKPPALIFPFMPHFSLHHCLHETTGECTLDWKVRCEIMQGTAAGLAYCHPLFLHLNLKAYNILLDSEYRAKISDFSVQCHLPYKVGSTSLISASDVSALVGTRGYLPPEHGDGQQGPETDVYSYGIICLEIYTGLLVYCTTRDNYKLFDHCSDELELWKDKVTFKTYADKCGVASNRVVEVFFHITERCTRKNFRKRCTMDEVVQMWTDMS